MERPFNHARTLCIVGVSATALLWAAAPAFAQDAVPAPAPASEQEPTTVDEIVVTGFRSSLQQALNIKRRPRGA